MEGRRKELKAGHLVADLPCLDGGGAPSLPADLLWYLGADFCGYLAADGAMDGDLHGVAVPHRSLGELRPADGGAHLLVAGHLWVVHRHGAALLEGDGAADGPVGHRPPAIALLLAVLLLLLQLLLQAPLLLPPPLLLPVAESGGSLPLSPVSVVSSVALCLVEGVALLVVCHHRGLVAHLPGGSGLADLPRLGDHQVLALRLRPGAHHVLADLLELGVADGLDGIFADLSDHLLDELSGTADRGGHS